MVDGLRAYGLIAWMWMRSLLAYRGSFLLAVGGNFAVSGLEFVTIVVMFSHLETLAGFTLAEVALLYGATNCSLGLADLLLGNLDRIGGRVRDGSLDPMLVRPVPVFAQLAADRFALRRLGRLAQGVLVLGWAVVQLDEVRAGWSPLEWLLLVSMVLSGAAIYGAIFTLGGSFQFWAQDAAQVQDSLTYGGNTMLRYPPSVFGMEVVRGLTFVIPLAFVNWVPALRLLERDGPLGLPGWVDFLSPVVAAVLCGLAALLWRAALRQYRSTGS